MGFRARLQEQQQGLAQVSKGLSDYAAYAEREGVRAAALQKEEAAAQAAAQKRIFDENQTIENNIFRRNTAMASQGFNIWDPNEQQKIRNEEYSRFNRPDPSLTPVGVQGSLLPPDQQTAQQVPQQVPLQQQAPTPQQLIGDVQAAGVAGRGVEPQAIPIQALPQQAQPPVGTTQAGGVDSVLGVNQGFSRTPEYLAKQKLTTAENAAKIAAAEQKARDPLGKEQFTFEQNLLQRHKIALQAAKDHAIAQRAKSSKVGDRGKKGRDALNTAFAKEKSAFQLSGGFGAAAAGIKTLRFVIDEIASDEFTASGPLSSLGDIGTDTISYNKMFRPRTENVKNMVEQVVQKNLRLILGAQFTEREGVRLIARAWNPALSEEINSTRVQILIEQMEEAFAAKVEANAWFTAHDGDMTDFEGKIYKANEFTQKYEEAAGIVDPYKENPAEKERINKLYGEEWAVHKERYKGAVINIPSEKEYGSVRDKLKKSSKSQRQARYKELLKLQGK